MQNTRKKVGRNFSRIAIFAVFIELMLLILARADDSTTNSVLPNPNSTNSISHPDYQQTREWILSKVNQLGGETISDKGWVSKYSYDEMSIQGAVLKYTMTISGTSWDGSYLTSEVINVPLDQITNIYVNSVENGQLVALWFQERTQAIRARGTHTKTFSNGDTQTSNTDHTAINGSLIFARSNSDRIDIATRMKNAFENLIRICKEGAPKSSEPF